ncbi:MAG: hypothetical protein ACLGXA_19475 [Acidobacteriota bacterium]
MQESLYRWLEPRVIAHAAEACVQLSRLLLLVIAIEVITMPLTQQLWTWDGFLRGGQDFELGLFMIMVCLCLGLLRAQDGRQRVRVLLALRRRLGEIFGGRPRRTPATGWWAAALEAALHRSHTPSLTPLLI